MAFVGFLAFTFGWALTWKNHVVLATVAQDPQLPHVELAGYSFHSQVFGDPLAPAIVVIHGGPGGDYRNLLPLQDLAPDFYVVFYDQRGSGLSPRVDDPSTITLESSVADLDAVIDHYASGRKVILLGHSWGAMLAVAYTARHPDKVSTMVLAEPGFLTPQIGEEVMARITPGFSFSALRAATRSFFETLHVSGPDADAHQDYFLQRVMYDEAASPLSGYWCDDRPPAAARLIWRVGAAAQQALLDEIATEDGKLEFDLLSGIGAYKGRTLLLASSCNQILGVDLQRRHEELLTGKGLTVDLQVIEGSGHLIFAERPNSITRVWSYLREGINEVRHDQKPPEIASGTGGVPPNN